MNLQASGGWRRENAEAYRNPSSWEPRTCARLERRRPPAGPLILRDALRAPQDEGSKIARNDGPYTQRGFAI